MNTDTTVPRERHEFTAEEIGTARQICFYERNKLHVVIRGWYIHKPPPDEEHICSWSGCNHRAQMEWTRKDIWDQGEWLCGEHFFKVQAKWAAQAKWAKKQNQE